jgi:hypothetical protein
MAITDVKRLTERDGEWLLSSDGFDRSYNYVFLVQTNDINDGPATVIQSLPFTLGAPYIGESITEGDLGAQLNKIRLSHVNKNPKLWRVEIGFASLQGNDPEEVEKPDPTDREPKVGVRFEKIQRVTTADITTDNEFDPSAPAVNTKGQAFNPPPTYERTVPVIWAYEDSASFSFDEACETQDLINSEAFLGCPERTLLLNIVNVEERFENAQRLWRKHYELRHNPLTWDNRVLNHGVVDDGQGVFREALLSSDSTVLSATQTSLVVYLTFRPYMAVDFSSSPLVPTVIQILPSLPLS